MKKEAGEHSYKRSSHNENNQIVEIRKIRVAMKSVEEEGWNASTSVREFLLIFFKSTSNCTVYEWCYINILPFPIAT